jgi:hypothetical protein
LAPNGRVSCWGWDGYNRITTGPLANAVGVAVIDSQACIIRKDTRTVHCWGDSGSWTYPNAGVRFTKLYASYGTLCGYARRTDI